MVDKFDELIYALNIHQREKIVALLKEFRKEAIYEQSSTVEKRVDVEHCCDKLIESIESTTAYELVSIAKEKAFKIGTTTIPKENWGVHETHCCLEHGCKYGDIDCPVAMDLIKQRYPCETCSETCNDKDYDN